MHFIGKQYTRSPLQAVHYSPLLYYLALNPREYSHVPCKPSLRLGVSECYEIDYVISLLNKHGFYAKILVESFVVLESANTWSALLEGGRLKSGFDERAVFASVINRHQRDITLNVKGD